MRILVGFADPVLPIAGNPGVADLSIEPRSTPPAGKIDLTLTLSADKVKGGSTVTGTVTLSSPAPPGGVTLIPGSFDPNVASVPDSLTIPAGASSGSFVITTHPVAVATEVGIAVDFSDANFDIAGSIDAAFLTVTP